MSSTLDEIRRKLQEIENRKQGNFTNNDKLTYPHWNIPEGTSAVVRFLPDKNEDNTFFWIEKQTIRIPFRGILGHDESKPVEIQVPCVEMWDGKNSCPILNEVRPWWKGDQDMQDLARKYWIKRNYLMQGFVKTDPLNEETPENPIRRFNISPQIFTLIKAALLDPDMGPISPVDYVSGVDFVISKTSKGGHSDYTTSKWARKESSINEEMYAAIEQFGLVDLATYLPKKPSPADLAVMFDMFQSSVDNELYDPERFAEHFKPYGFDNKPTAKTDTRTTFVPKSTPAPSKEFDDDVATAEASINVPATTTVQTASTTPKAKSPQEILELLRNRNKG